MVRVLKKSSLELMADIEEFFDGATVEEATEKAHNQKMPGELAKINITDNKFIKATIKMVGEEYDDRSKKILELKRQQDEEARKMNKFRIFVEKKKNLIAELSSKILEEEDKRPFRVSS
jgi:hypothetical protein